jgi:hypothetical protein
MKKPAELKRIDEKNAGIPWHKWGPYLSERQWGTVREDYSPHGSAWDYFPHDHARSRAYRWGEDGIAGISDDQQNLCFSVALWNGKDPILKERLFGLTGPEGNHAEDCKELYYYLDATPTHSYLKYLYKYPQAAYPYSQLVEENRRRTKKDAEFELLDTGVFNDDRYFDVFVEYAKVGVDDLLIRITAHNRGPDCAPLWLIPQAWFRNTWSWRDGKPKPTCRLHEDGVEFSHPAFGEYVLHFEEGGQAIFCDNETNAKKLWGNDTSPPFPKDAFHEFVVNGNKSAVNPQEVGTKAGILYRLHIPAGESITIDLRLAQEHLEQPFRIAEKTWAARIDEADQFYAQLHEDMPAGDARLVHRQAMAGMIWTKQFFSMDVRQWLEGDPLQIAPPESRKRGRNSEWIHLNNDDVISMPDKWEYPWYAAWDLAFHTVPLAQLDMEFAKNQLILLCREWYMHPNGQLPAYEWAFGDVNPPVHAWATWKVYELDKQIRGRGDTAFLERVFHKLLMNFTWWVNRKDVQGHNIFQGGFLGLDNIGVFDRSAPLPIPGYLSQCDGTAWMAMYSLNLMRIALELAWDNAIYQDLAIKFFEHFLYIAAAMNNVGGQGISLWDEDDKFYYDVLVPADGSPHIPLKVHSMVGLMPLVACEVLDAETLRHAPEFTAKLEWFLNYRPDLANLVSRWKEQGRGETRLLSLLRGHRMKRLLKRLLDPNEFLSDYGVRALSKVHLDNPYVIDVRGMRHEVRYTPGESDTHLFGGNSNWRGPIWFPTNFLLIDSIRRFHTYYGDDFRVECPTGSGQFLSLAEIADDLAGRLTRIFLRDEHGNRAVFHGQAKHNRDPHFRDYPLFYEYFHGDTGRGVGASHQTGWTGLIATLLSDRKVVSAAANGKRATALVGA